MSTDYFPTNCDAKRVKRFIRAGIVPEKIAVILRISMEELLLHYPIELDHTDEEDLAEVAQTAFEMATSGQDSKMTQWWLERKGGHTFNNAPTPPTLARPMTVMLANLGPDEIVDGEFEEVDD